MLPKRTSLKCKIDRVWSCWSSWCFSKEKNVVMLPIFVERLLSHLNDLPEEFEKAGIEPPCDLLSELEPLCNWLSEILIQEEEVEIPVKNSFNYQMFDFLEKLKDYFEENEMEIINFMKTEYLT